ncbi:MAG TPA: DMT family transporter [Chloroflexota bacterium]|nr:DMT family transporter [Chloroflexota bacterium]
MGRERAGVLLCLISAAAFSSATILGRIALEDGVGVVTLLALRYSGAAPLFWGLVALGRQPLPRPDAALPVIGIGAVVVSLQALLIYMALERLDAGLVTLLLYTFPAMVAVAAVAIGRERPSWRKAGAVLVATIGIVLVLLGDVQLRADTLGVVLAIASAFLAAVWVLLSDRVVRQMPALVVSALIATGAALSVGGVGLATGSLVLGFGAAGWGALLGTILISTVIAISTSMAGVARVGPTVASILLTAEVPLAVTWAILLLGERLHAVQVVGAILVVAAVLLLQAGAIRWPGWASARFAWALRGGR